MLNFYTGLCMLAGILAAFVIAPLINPITVLTVFWFIAVFYGATVAFQVYRAGGFPLLWHFTKTSFTG